MAFIAFLHLNSLINYSLNTALQVKSFHSHFASTHNHLRFSKASAASLGWNWSPLVGLWILEAATTQLGLPNLRWIGLPGLPRLGNRRALKQSKPSTWPFYSLGFQLHSHSLTPASIHLPLLWTTLPSSSYCLSSCQWSATPSFPKPTPLGTIQLPNEPTRVWFVQFWGRVLVPWGLWG